MSQASITTLVIGIVVLALLIVRQVTTRRLRENYRLMVILAVIGVIEFVNFLKGHTGVDDPKIVVAVAGSLVLAAVFGLLRALTVKVWRESGQLLMKGSWLTGILWVIALAAHLGYDYLVVGSSAGKNATALGDSTVLLYLAVSLTVQRLILLSRAARMDAAGQLAT
ncbi:MAG TPA: hypothetical protein VHZ03_16645 [Trebonia sp.]|jgi:uncharacterized protein involved in response to NO|nr:hypothetical protein [Trebonia sp.]